MKQILWESQHFEFDIAGNINQVDENDDTELDEYEEIEFDFHPDKLMSTPFGVWKIDDSMNPLRQFKLWMGHANFDINSSVVNTIKLIPGVEVLHILTRYRFLIGIGELFDFGDVRVEIEKQICGAHTNSYKIDMIEHQPTKNKVIELKNSLETNHKTWGILIFPNGSIESCIDDLDKIKLLQNTGIYAGGIFIGSEYNG